MKSKLARLSMVTTCALGLFAATTPASLMAGATIVIVNMDGANEGFNDPTPVAPVGGNPGTTVGQQRLNALVRAAEIWGAELDSSAEIRIQASFDPLSCTPTSATLAAAGAIQIAANFPGATRANTWFPVALANRLVGQDLSPGLPGTSADDIIALFNRSLGGPGCLTGVGWYYGLDGNHGTQIDLVAVALHELAHGLGFANFVNEASGASPQGLPDIFSAHTLDTTTGKTWDQMSGTEIVASAMNSRRVVWTGERVKRDAGSVLAAGTPLVAVSSALLNDKLPIGTAAFGPPLTNAGVSGEVALVEDPVGGTSLACELPANAAALAGKIAVLDRGLCYFVVKVKNAQDAGAIGVIVVDNSPNTPPSGMAGVDPTIIIPSVIVGLVDGNRIKNALISGPVTATLLVDASVLLGTHPSGRLMLHAPRPLQTGSSISHWDPTATPNQLMEPTINSDVTHSVSAPSDLTRSLMHDIGWMADFDLDGVADDEDCNPKSDFRATVFVGTCDSGVPNTFFANGCTLADLIANAAATAKNHGGFVSEVARISNELVARGVITGKQKAALQTCAAKPPST